MSISAPFIARPVATFLLAIAVLLAGIFGYLQLPLSALPQVDFPTIEVSTKLPGASPETTALLITAPLERQLAQIPGVESLSSSSGFASSRIVLRFTLSKSMDEAAQDVQSALDIARGTLPADLPYPPTYARVNPADPPIISLALTSETLTLSKLSDTADSILSPRLGQILGVGRVTVQGSMRPAVRLKIDTQRLASYGLSLENVRQSVVAANLNSPKGVLETSTLSSTLTANDQLMAPEDFRNIIVSAPNQRPVFLRDIATVEEGLEDVRQAAFFQGKPAILIDIQRQPGANIVQTVESIQEQLSTLSSSLPTGITLHVLADRTDSIRAAVHEVQWTLVLSVVLVIIVMFFFLGSARATLIPAVVLPLSIIGTFTFMWAWGFSLNTLSLMALTIATGFVVDDAIVMVENIARMMEEGRSREEAAYEGAKQISFTIISLSLSLVAVFIPLLFMQGVVGRLFREFAQTLSAAVLVSMIISLTLTPMMCRLILKSHHNQQKFWIVQKFDQLFLGIKHRYAKALTWSLQHQRITLLVSLAILVMTVGFYIFIPKGFLPTQDTGLVQITLEGPQNASFAQTTQLFLAASERLQRHQSVKSVNLVVGTGTVNMTQNTARVWVELQPKSTRAQPLDTILEEFRQNLAQIPDLKAIPLLVQELQVSTKTSGAQYQYTLSDPNRAVVGEWAQALYEALQQESALQDVSTDQYSKGQYLTLDIDRQKAAQLGVSAQILSQTLQNAFAQRQISTIYAQSNQYRVVMEAHVPAQNLQGFLENLHVSGGTSEHATQIPLSQLVSFKTRQGPLLLSQERQFPSATLSFNLAPGQPLDAALSTVEKTAHRIGVPAHITQTFSGDAAEFQASLAGQIGLVLAALVVIYIVLGVLYESLIHPLTILSTLPSAGIGALLALHLFDLDLSLVGIIGILLLMGIVKKNGIMVVDFAIEAQRDHGSTPYEAVYEASLLRFRPIIMTTLAALLGALPLIFSQGAGAELRLPLGVSIVGGLLLSQLITLFTTPSIYLMFESLKHRLGPSA